MARSKKQKSPAKAPAKKTAKKTPKKRGLNVTVHAQPVDLQTITAMFSRPEGCTVREYAEALCVTRQAAQLRLARFVRDGLVVVTQRDAVSPLSVEALVARDVVGQGRTKAYRLTSAAILRPVPTPAIRPPASEIPAIRAVLDEEPCDDVAVI